MTDYAKHTMSDIHWVVKSKKVAGPTDTVHDVCRVPANCLVTNVIVVIETGYSDAGATLLAGFTGNGETADPNAFIDSVVDWDVVGSYSMLQDTAKNSGGKHFTKGGMITVTSDDNTGTAGTFTVFVQYSQIHN